MKVFPFLSKTCAYCIVYTYSSPEYRPKAICAYRPRSHSHMFPSAIASVILPNTHPAIKVNTKYIANSDFVIFILLFYCLTTFIRLYTYYRPSSSGVKKVINRPHAQALHCVKQILKIVIYIILFGGLPNNFNALLCPVQIGRASCRERVCTTV